MYIRLIYILAFFALSSYHLYSQKITKRVMFLGNSYTFVNDLPLMLSQLAAGTGDSLYYDSNTPGGYTLQGHSTNQASLSLIQQGGWDFMIIQEQSQLPSFPMSQFMSQSYPYAKMLCTKFRKYNQCGSPLFFMTWGRKNGDNQNCQVWPPVCTYQGMDSLLNLRYRMMADSNEALVSPVGAVWHYIRDNYPNIELYDTDESHPSQAGTYAAACTFYSMIFQKDPTNISKDMNLDPIKAANIRNAAKVIAFDSLAKWNVGKFLPEAAFTFTKISWDTVEFHNTGKFASAFEWDFGDGDTALTANPVHVYKNGSYTVTLKAKKCDLWDTTSTLITIIPNGITENGVLKNIIIYPNPAKNSITVSSSENLGQIEIFGLDGRRILSVKTGNKTVVISTTNLKQGSYAVKVQSSNGTKFFKLIKL